MVFGLRVIHIVLDGGACKVPAVCSAGAGLASVASNPIGPRRPLFVRWRAWVLSGRCSLLLVRKDPRGRGTGRRPVSLEISGRG